MLKIHSKKNYTPHLSVVIAILCTLIFRYHLLTLICVIFSLLFLIKSWIVGDILSETFITQNSKSLKNKTVLITGGNSGIGREITRQLLTLGVKRVIIGCRDILKAERMRKEFEDEDNLSEELVTRLVFRYLDLTDLDSVQEFADLVLEYKDNLDILINNAGVCGHRGTTKEEFEIHFGVNYLGHFYLTNLLTEKILDSDTFIINVSSFEHKKSRFFRLEEMDSSCDEYYRQSLYRFSKLCMEYFTMELQKRFSFRNERETKCDAKIVSFCPGVVRTAISRYYIGKLWFLKYVYHSLGYFFTKNVNEGCQTLLGLILLSDSLEGGGYYENLRLVSRGKNCEDEKFQRVLWRESEKFVKL